MKSLQTLSLVHASAHKGFKYILDGMNAERILIAAECIGDGRFFIDQASAYGKDRSVFGRAIGENPLLSGAPSPPTSS